MAHILVYLQRTPLGLHPASAIALCIARDIGTERGATVTALCPGDAGRIDEGIARAAGRFGADVVMFIGPKGLANLQDRLRPVHVLAPWTREGLQAIEPLPNGPPTPRWVDTADQGWQDADTITGVLAGVGPWHDHETILEAEYEGDVESVELPAWVKETLTAMGTDGGAPVFDTGPGKRIAFTGAADVDGETTTRLASIGAKPLEELADHRGGTLLWLGVGTDGLPEDLGNRHPSTRVVLLPGTAGSFHPSWAMADWVLPGPPAEALAQLERELLGTGSA